MDRCDEWIEWHACDEPEGIAWEDAGVAWSWDALAEEVEGARGALDLLGVCAGDRVALWLPNGRAHVVLLAACAGLGAVAVFLNTRASAPEARAQLEHVEAKVCVTTAERASGALGGLAGALDASRWGALVEGASRRRATRHGSLDAPALILFTSGTTGRPRGATLSHRNLATSARQFVRGLGLTSRDVNYAAAPLFHAAGLGCFTLPLLLVGGRTVSAPRFDPAASAVALTGATCAFMVPSMWRAVALAAPVGWGGALRVGLSGGAPLPMATRDLVARRLGVDLHVGYGMTETSPSATLAAPAEVAARAGFVGRPDPEMSCRITGPGGAPLPAGAVGEVQLRGPNVTLGYWRDEEATGELLQPDGWLRTGDLGALDASGGLTLSGRLEDMIITGGENVYPAEVERGLAGAPGLHEVAVFGTPHPRWGEAVTAAVVCDDGWDLERLRSHLSALSRYKHPTRWLRMERLPRGGSGKVLRGELSSAWRARRSRG